MKWPEYLCLLRHDRSTYNDSKQRKAQDVAYQRFVELFEQNPDSLETHRMARAMHQRWSLNIGDHNTPLSKGAGRQALITGQKLKTELELPDVIYVSPYLRTRTTLEQMIKGWPELATVKTYEDERIIEQGHGLALLYNDWRIFHVFHPDQRKLFAIEGSYYYRFPQGENVSDVRQRCRSWVETLIREFSNKKVLAITHHLCILAIRANLERLNANEFIRLDKDEPPINCGVTTYQGNPQKGSKGHLELKYYNRKLY